MLGRVPSIGSMGLSAGGGLGKNATPASSFEILASSSMTDGPVSPPPMALFLFGGNFLFSLPLALRAPSCARPGCFFSDGVAGGLSEPAALRRSLELTLGSMGSWDLSNLAGFFFADGGISCSWPKSQPIWRGF
jgi:hypothetical protein